MTKLKHEDAVRTQIVVAAPIERALRVFTEQFDRIKPREHNMLGVDIAKTVFEPRVGGHIYDRGVDGSECRWARVLAYEPPERVVIELEHRHLDRHGEGWEATRDGVASDGGWPLYLRKFSQLLEDWAEGHRLHPDTVKYNKAQAPDDQDICDLLAREIDRGLPEAENKIWHAHPVWFLDGNPIVGYSKLKGCIRLLFWSGQSFEEGGLAMEGSFKAAEARYAAADQVDTHDLERWLAKARDVQWDYKNLTRRRGRLERLK